ncbi:hypothetical protein LEMLEM_LOCUS22302, partial [Lemmus lemmus]
MYFSCPCGNALAASSTNPRPMTIHSTTPQELESHSELLPEEEGPRIVVTLGVQEHQRGSKGLSLNLSGRLVGQEVPRICNL